jgi:membrane-bound lytic murein transglycosylase A
MWGAVIPIGDSSQLTMTSAKPAVRAFDRAACVLRPQPRDVLDALHAEAATRALSAFRLQAEEILARGSGFSRKAIFGGERQDWLEACRESLSTNNAQAFFRHHFQAFEVNDPDHPEGLYTGYFEPEVEGSLVPSDDYPVPVLRKPADLVAFTPEEEALTGLRYGRRINGQPFPYAERREIENGLLSNKGLEICWLKSWVEAFFMHIQGSGRVKLQNGETLRLSYAAKTGLPYTGVGGVLAERKVLTRETMSMQTVKAWMAENPALARELMWQNKSYIFFRAIEVEDEKLGAVGAAQVNLIPHHSMAVDRAYWMFGTPFWIETSYPPEASERGTALNSLMIAQDTGSAIKGASRGDFYWGWGDAAAQIAGHMKSKGRMTVFLPHAVVERLGLPARPPLHR